MKELYMKVNQSNTQRILKKSAFDLWTMDVDFVP